MSTPSCLQVWRWMIRSTCQNSQEARGGQKSGGFSRKAVSGLLRNASPGSHARALELKFWNSPSLHTLMRDGIPPFQGTVRLKPGSFHLSPILHRGTRATWGFLDSGTSWCPQSTASNSPNELISFRGQRPSKGLTAPTFILTNSSPVLDSAGNGRVPRQGPSPL